MASPPTQLVQFAFAGGIDQAVRDEVVDPSSAFVFIQNGRQDDRGALSRRHGLTARATTRMDGTSISAGLRLFGFEKLTGLNDGTYLHTWSEAASRWVNVGRVPDASLSMVGLPGIGGDSTSLLADAIVCGNYIVAMATTPLGNQATILDARTGAVVKAAAYVNSTTDTPMLATYGNAVMAFFWRNSDATIRYQWIDLTSATTINTGWSASADACTDGTPAATHLYMSVCGLSDRVALIYVNDSASTDRVNVKTLTVSGVIDSATMSTASVAVTHVAIAPDGAGGLVTAWNETTDIKACALSSALAVIGTVATVISGWSSSTSATHAVDVCGSGTSGCGKVFGNRDTDATGDQLNMREFVTSGAGIVAAGTTYSIYNARKIGRAFRVGTRYYALCRGYERSTNEAVVCDLSESSQYVRPVANIRPGLASGQPTAQGSAFGNVVHVPVRTQTSGSTYAAELAALDFGSTQRGQPVRFGRSIFLSGACVAETDMHRMHEAAFVVHPPQPTTADSGVAGNPDGAYRHAIVYEHVDANGNWHASGVSLPSASLTVATNQITVTVRSLSITGRSFPYTGVSTDPGIRISVYRTLAGGEPPYYYVGSVSNPTTAATTTYTDDSSDATIAANAKLYASSLPGVNGGSQDHRSPPGLAHLEVGNGVLLGAIDEDLWHSSQDVSGEGLWWSPIFSGPVSGDGPITGIKYQDGTFYVFKRRAIYAVTCEPPTDNGAAGGLGTPRRLAVDVGCVDNRSLLVTSLGIFFQSERGIEILTRAQSVEWLGEAIGPELGSATVVSATLDAARGGLVYFELDTGSKALVYDLTRRIWQSVDTRSTTAAGGAIVWDPSQSAYRYAWLTSGGAVHVEQSGYLDAGTTWITMKARTGWVKLGGIQGQQIFNRALLLAKRATSSDIALSLAYDYNETFEAATEWAATTIDTLSTALSRVQLQHDAHDDAEGQAVRVSIEDSTPTGASVGTGQGATWIALTFEGQPRQNAAHVPQEAA